ncbi:hypothetical protein BDV26DRAFT_83910 [Aspergillus bertholletiae]|uniref:Uncharacterized protein n=1 Tax=Aspergillus bertholletiae TaxID=1226010 RepID=A0A5N7ASF9_9EURO|nr:hypothetical protein BDV26DRAFT_83910 [Aspergillus bertholletiae]
MEQTEKGTFIAKASIPVMDEISGSSGKDAIYTSSVDLTPGQLKVTLRIGDGLEDTVTSMLDDWKQSTPKPQAFKSLVLYIKLVTGEAWGHYTEIAEEPGEDGPIHAVHADHSDKHRELHRKFPAAIASSPIAHLNYGLNCNLYSISANIHAAPSPKAAMLREVMNDRPLAIGELQTLDIPGDFDVHHVTQNYIMAAAGYWRGEKEKSVFGDGKGANEKILPDSLKLELMKPNQTFLADVYTRALFLYNLSTSEQYQAHFTGEQKEKLEYFWSGKVCSWPDGIEQFTILMIYRRAKPVSLAEGSLLPSTILRVAPPLWIKSHD